MKNRYPGPQPFSYDERELFFGREQEIELLSTIVMNNKTTILHGKSGYGKTSLINAGVIPYLLGNFNCEIIRIRFYNYDKKRFLNPLNTFLKALQIQQLSDELYIHQILKTDHESAWRYFKKLQSKTLKKVTVGEEESVVSNSNYILLFDQFEELFTYPKQYVLQFGRELHDLLHNRIPNEYQSALKEGFKDKKALLASKEELSVLDKDIPVKVLFSVRSDRFNYLTYLSDFIPNFLNNTYKLKRMAEQQVIAAIKNPAVAKNGFDCPQFEYEPRVLKNILEFLYTSADEENNKLEVFEMQIICRKLEEILYEHIKTMPEDPGKQLVLTEQIILGTVKMTDSKKLFPEIIKDYYIDSITSIKSEPERLAARYLIERKLIDPITKIRVSLDDTFVSQSGACPETLTHLIDKRIIRVEINTISGRNYELSHGSLVAPVLDAAKELGNLDNQLNAFFKASLTGIDKEEKKKLTRVIYDLLPDENQESGLRIDQIDEEIRDKILAHPVVTRATLGTGKDKDNNTLLIKETFFQAVQKSALRSQQNDLRNVTKRYAIIVGVCIIVIAALLGLMKLRSDESNRYYGLVYVGYNIDKIQGKDTALMLMQDIYEQSWNKQAEKEKLESKFLELFKTKDLQTNLARFSKTLPTSSLRSEDIDISPSGNFVVVRMFDDTKNSGTAKHFKLMNTDTADKITSKETDFYETSYAYFTNHADTLLLGREIPTPAEDVPENVQQANKAGDSSIILYDCKKGHISRVIHLGKRRSLYSLKEIRSNLNSEFDSYMIRFTASGNLIVPFLELDPKNNLVRKVGIWFPNKDSVILNSDMTISTSKDEQKIMTGMYEKSHRPAVISIYNSNGQPIDTIQNSKFADFTPLGSVVYSTQQQFVVRDYAAGIPPQRAEHSITTSSQVAYGYTNNQQTAAALKIDDSIYLANLTNSKVEPRKLYEQMIDINTAKGVIITRNIEPYYNASDSIPDTLYRRSMLADQNIYYICKDGIKNTQYNFRKDQILLLTRKDELLLIDSSMTVKSALQLTNNDLFGFTRDGSRIYYIRDNSLCVFNNDNSLIDIFNFSQAYKWHKNHPKIAPSLKETVKKKYELHFKSII